MVSRRYKSGVDRTQSHLFPPSLDDYVSAHNPVRAIDAYVSTLNLQQLAFCYSDSGAGRGQPAYDPADLLKLYLYGYINHVRSSRKLERETYRNVEVMWLIHHQHPCYKTIADFRKNNSEALKRVNRDFVLLCRELGLYGGETVAIDGSFFRGNAGKGSILTEKKLNRQLARLEEQIAAYQQELENNDQCEARVKTVEGQPDDPQLSNKLEQLKVRQQLKQAELESLKTSDQTQLSATDKDARLLSKSGQSVVGYNVQSVIDAKHHLLVCSDVTNDGNDLQQLYPMASQAKTVLSVNELTALADAGYYKTEHLKACEDEQITVFVPEPDKTRNYIKQGRYTRDVFVYDESQNIYTCPQGESLRQLGQPYAKDQRVLIRYSSKASICKACEMRNHCLTKNIQTRQVYRWEHEAVLERHRKRMSAAKHEMTQRASLVEHPFGTLKDRAGWACHFLVRGFKNVSGEWSLMAWGYNFTRTLNILGIKQFIAYCTQRRQPC